MGAHESPESMLAAVETDAIRLRALALVNQYEAHDAFVDSYEESGEYMDREAWLRWEGVAYAVLKEMARG